MWKKAYLVLIISSLFQTSTQAAVKFEDIFHECPTEDPIKEQCVAGTLGSFTTASSGAADYMIGLQLTTSNDVGLGIECCVQTAATNLRTSHAYCLNSAAGTFFNTQLTNQAGSNSSFNQTSLTFQIYDGNSATTSQINNVTCTNFGSVGPSCTTGGAPAALGVINPDGGTGCASMDDTPAGQCVYQTGCAGIPCFNGGTCTNVGTSGYTCACTPCFMGTHCEQINPACA